MERLNTTVIIEGEDNLKFYQGLPKGYKTRLLNNVIRAARIHIQGAESKEIAKDRLQKLLFELESNTFDVKDVLGEF